MATSSTCVERKVNSYLSSFLFVLLFEVSDIDVCSLKKWREQRLSEMHDFKILPTDQTCFFLILDTQGLEWEDDTFPMVSKEAPTAQIEC